MDKYAKREGAALKIRKGLHTGLMRSWVKVICKDEYDAGGLEFCINELYLRVQFLERTIRETLEENPHLADGDNCTLAKLKKVME
jgi:hypothetical protein